MSTGINRATLREWREHPEPSVNPRIVCPRCAEHPTLPEPRAVYAYLLGLYLGDGCISRAGARDKEVWKLRVMCADAWPGLIRECERAMRSIRPDSKVGIQQKPGCAEVWSCSRHWPCLFPQHGPGRKHMRTIELTSWQRAIIVGNPGHFARELFHSDGFGELTGCGRIARTAIIGTSILGTCFPTSRATSSGCAVRRWTNSGWLGGSRDRMPFRWHAGRRWRGWMSSSGLSLNPPRK